MAGSIIVYRVEFEAPCRDLVPFGRTVSDGTTPVFGHLSVDRLERYARMAADEAWEYCGAHGVGVVVKQIVATRYDLTVKPYHIMDDGQVLVLPPYHIAQVFEKVWWLKRGWELPELPDGELPRYYHASRDPNLEGAVFDRIWVTDQPTFHETLKYMEDRFPCSYFLYEVFPERVEMIRQGIYSSDIHRELAFEFLIHGQIRVVRRYDEAGVLHIGQGKWCPEWRIIK